MIKLSGWISTLSQAELKNVKSSVIEAYLESIEQAPDPNAADTKGQANRQEMMKESSEKQENMASPGNQGSGMPGGEASNDTSSKSALSNKKWVNRGEPIILKNTANNLYLGVKKFNQQMVVLSYLENTECEFVFIIETKGDLVDRVKYNDSFQIKSLLGGTLALHPSSEEVNIDSLIENNSSELRIEDEEQLKLEEIYQGAIERHNLVKDLEPINIFTPLSYSLKYFTLEKVSDFERNLTLSMSDLFNQIVQYHVYVQEWGNVSGKSLKNTLVEGAQREYMHKFQDENYYYDFEEASETQDKLINNTGKLRRVLHKVCSQMSQQNYIEGLTWVDRLCTPALLLQMRQKAVADLGIFDYLALLVKLILQKTYLSIDFSALFKVYYDTERRREGESNSKRQKLKRLIIDDRVDWKKLRQTPQSVCKGPMDKISELCLKLVLLGIKNNPQNVSLVADYSDQFFFLYSFFPELCQEILEEVNKFMVYTNDNHVSGTDADRQLGVQGGGHRREASQHQRPGRRPPHLELLLFRLGHEQGHSWNPEENSDRTLQHWNQSEDERRYLLPS